MIYAFRSSYHICTGPAGSADVCYTLGMNIRRAAASDYAGLMELYNLFVGSDRYSRHDNDSFADVMDSDSHVILVADDDGTLVGFATISFRSVVRYPQPIAELDELFVLPEYRKHGIGRLLMAQLEELARTRRCYRLYIESHRDHTGAHAFYAALGYTNYGYHFIKNLSG